MARQGKKWVYRFDEGNSSMRDLLGGKGANLCEMARLGLPVPPGSIITTEACLKYYEGDDQLPEGLWEEVQTHMGWLEKSIGREFGASTNPLLVSVRSGARVSMPGMMDTILNLGINDEIVNGLARLMGDERPALDAQRRFIQVFGSVVMGMDASVFEEMLAGTKWLRESGWTMSSTLSTYKMLFETSRWRSMTPPAPMSRWTPGNS